MLHIAPGEYARYASRQALRLAATVHRRSWQYTPSQLWHAPGGCLHCCVCLAASGLVSAAVMQVSMHQQMWAWPASTAEPDQRQATRGLLQEAASERETLSSLRWEGSHVPSSSMWDLHYLHHPHTVRRPGSCWACGAWRSCGLCHRTGRSRQPVWQLLQLLALLSRPHLGHPSPGLCQACSQLGCRQRWLLALDMEIASVQAAAIHAASKVREASVQCSRCSG